MSVPFRIVSITISASTFTVFQEIYLTDGEWAIFKGTFLKRAEREGKDISTYYICRYPHVYFMCIYSYNRDVFGHFFFKNH